MFRYNKEKMEVLLLAVIRDNLSMDRALWLEDRCKSSGETGNLNATFAMIPRKVGKVRIAIGEEQANQAKKLRPGFSIEGWSIDRLSRAYLLMQVDAEEMDSYFRAIENLFLAAEMSELVALYSSLPLLAYPELWTKRCAEGIRSNIGPVLESIIYHNPYPAENLDQAAWNQLVLKAFFTDKIVNNIYGLDERSNLELAYILSDYAHERWAAHREINPQLWRLTIPFLDDRLFRDIKRVYTEGDEIEKRAAALVAYHSKYAPAKDLLNADAHLKTAIEDGGLTWDSLSLNLAKTD